MRLLSRSELGALVPMDKAIAAVAHAFAQLSSGQAEVPLRQHIPVEQSGGLALIMPAYLAGSGGLGVKLLSLFPGNAGGPRPVIQALVAVFDAQDGTPLALLDGTGLTTLRTGAASGVATQHMARPEARTLAVFGAGATAFHQALAVCTVRPIERIWLCNRTASRAEELAESLRQHGQPIPADIRTTSQPPEALAEADVVCLATSSPTPLFEDADLRPGTHINAIGSYMPSMQEAPAASVARARVVVDQREAAWAEAGDLIIPRDQGLFDAAHVVGELGEVVAGRVAGRTSSEEITFFKSVGNAVQDVAVAQLAESLARELKRGIEIALDA